MEGHEEETLGKSILCAFYELRENTTAQQWYGSLGLRSKLLRSLYLKILLERLLLHASCCRIYTTVTRTFPETHVAGALCIFHSPSILHSSMTLVPVSSLLGDSNTPPPTIIAPVFET